MARDPWTLEVPSSSEGHQSIALFSKTAAALGVLEIVASEDGNQTLIGLVPESGYHIHMYTEELPDGRTRYVIAVGW